jgi:chromosome segregation ATPase
MEPERDREWENWPGRGMSETRARGRLRGLFTPTDDEEFAIEALIEARGRELEERTAELTTIVGDLQRREDETRRLRSAVEELLRDGAAELDERHAQLTALSTETTRRERELEELENTLEERRQELGAVELRRAAVERREAHVVDQQAELDRLRDEIAERAVELEGRATDVDRRRTELEQQSSRATALTVEMESRREEIARREAALEALRMELEDDAKQRAEAAAAATPAAQYADDEHVLVVPGAGYRFAYMPGPAPEPGREVELDGLRYRVMRIGRSSLPGDRRASAFLERI